MVYITLLTVIIPQVHLCVIVIFNFLDFGYLSIYSICDSALYGGCLEVKCREGGTYTHPFFKTSG